MCGILDVRSRGRAELARRRTWGAAPLRQRRDPARGLRGPRPVRGRRCGTWRWSLCSTGSSSSSSASASSPRRWPSMSSALLAKRRRTRSRGALRARATGGRTRSSRDDPGAGQRSGRRPARVPGFYSRPIKSIRRPKAARLSGFRLCGVVPAGAHLHGNQEYRKAAMAAANGASPRRAGRESDEARDNALTGQQRRDPRRVAGDRHARHAADGPHLALAA